MCLAFLIIRVTYEFHDLPLHLHMRNRLNLLLCLKPVTKHVHYTNTYNEKNNSVHLTKCFHPVSHNLL